MEDYPLISVAVPLIGVIIGGVLTVVGQQFAAWRARRNLRRDLGAALAGEIEAYLEITRRRGYINQGRTAGENLRTGNPVVLRGWVTTAEATTEPFRIYRASLAQLGILGPVFGKMARFYGLAEAVRATAIRAEQGYYDDDPPAAVADLIDQEIAVWEEVEQLGAEIVATLRSRPRFAFWRSPLAG